MVNVWTVCVGEKYTDRDVLLLQSQVSKNLSQPHRFRCLSDRARDGIDCFVPSETWPGWWSKLLLFRYAAGQVLYLDLDVVVTGELDSLLSERLSLPSNWGQSGHGGCQSSVMSWDTKSGSYGVLADLFHVESLTPPANGNYGYYQGLWGDQEYITQHLGNPGRYIREMHGVYSYKYHCQGDVPDDASVVCFHGAPKPKDVKDSWVIEARSYM